MDWKDFLKPTKRKILFSILLFIFSILYIFITGTMVTGLWYPLQMFITLILSPPIFMAVVIDPLLILDSLLIGIALTAVYNYLLVCFLVFIYNKVRK